MLIMILQVRRLSGDLCRGWLFHFLGSTRLPDGRLIERETQYLNHSKRDAPTDGCLQTANTLTHHFFETCDQEWDTCAVRCSSMEQSVYDQLARFITEF
jgi:hypothetical protein